MTACNGSAREAGIAPGQLVPDAMALCPSLGVHDAAPEADRAALEKLARWCGRYTPWSVADPVGVGAEPDGLLLDISGCAHLFGGEAALLDEMAARLGRFGFGLRAAIASTPGAAWALARYGREAPSVLPAGEEKRALAGLPVRGLRLDRGVADGLSRLGLKRIGDLYDKPRAPLTARFGPVPARRLDEALGRAPEPISPSLPHVPFRTRLHFAEPIARLEHVEEALARLAGDLCSLLAEEHKGARRLRLTLYRVDGEVRELHAGTSAPSHEEGHLARLFREKLDKAGDDFDAGFGIEAMSLACLAADDLAPSQARLTGGGPQAHDLARLIDRLGNRLGPGRVARAEPRASHIPERAVRAVPAMRGASPALAGWAREAAHLPEGVSRPLRLLPAAEPVEVVAEVPEGPPRIFRWRRMTYRVARAEGPERIAPEWWRQDSGQGENGKKDGGRTRDYYRVEDGDGRRFWLYRDGLYTRDEEEPRWYLHGVFG
ncbi:protein ImuB [Parvibaculum indicum]|nr:protein ImuB [Parvibaculum indicum]